jgi:transcriptional regulator with XRE-family HTH domain
MKFKHDGVAMKKSTKEKRRKIDEQVGNQLRTGRLIRGLSQQALAEQVDLTFQQLQKYERGTNRISASVLYEFSHILKIPFEDFFAGLPTAPRTPLLGGLEKDHYTLIRLYDSAPETIKGPLLKLLQAIVEDSNNA